MIPHNKTIMILLAVALTACSGGPPPVSGVAGEIEQALSEAGSARGRGEAAPAEEGGLPPEVGQALLPSIALESGQSEEAQEARFDIAASATPARQFFMSLVEGTAFNVIVHPDVRGEITLNLRNVTIPEVLESVAEVYGIDYQWLTDNNFLIRPAALTTRIFQVNYLNIARQGTSYIQVTAGSSSSSESDSSSTDSGSGSSGSSSSSGSTSQATVGSTINTTSESDFWKGLAQVIGSITGSDDGRRVVVDGNAGTVVVRAMPRELQEVAEFLDVVQKSLHRQVILEAKIIEVELSDGFRSGINWAALSSRDSGTRDMYTQTGGGPILGGVDGLGVSGSDLAGAGRFLAEGVLSQAPISSFGGMFAIDLALKNFSAFLELLETQGTVNVLSSPRISTVNNQKAVIKIGEDEYFVTGISSSTTTNDTTGATDSVPWPTFSRFFSGIALDVTPQISAGGDVTLHIHPVISEVKDIVKTYTINSQTQTLPLANSEIRESDTVVRAKSGQVVVIGGLMRSVDRDDAGKTPGLGDAPLVGGLFRQSQRQVVRSELVILLRPIVVEEEGDWVERIKSSAERIKEMRERKRKHLGLRTLSGQP